MERHRSERLSEAIREELEEIIAYEMGDPRIDAQGVSEVLISPDARHAHVRLTMTGDAQKQQETIEALNHARNYLRSELGRRLDVYRIPELHFEAAISAELGGRITTLLKRVKKGRPRQDSPTGVVPDATEAQAPVYRSPGQAGRPSDPPPSPLLPDPTEAQAPVYRSPAQQPATDDEQRRRNAPDTSMNPSHSPETSEKNKVP